jgi:uncharacterized protein
MSHVEMADSDLAELKRIVMGGLRDFNVQVYLFGSYARGNPHRCSDIDVAVLPFEPLPPGTLSQIREALEESVVPYTVDLVDLGQTEDSFRAVVLKEGTLWNG